MPNQFPNDLMPNVPAIAGCHAYDVCKHVSVLRFAVVSLGSLSLGHSLVIGYLGIGPFPGIWALVIRHLALPGDMLFLLLTGYRLPLTGY